MNVLGNRIKKERENLNLSREDLAKKLGVSYSAIAMYEQGNREPNSEIILKMCEIFGCTMDYLMGKVDFRNNIDIDIPKMLSLYKDSMKQNNIPEINYEILNDDEKNLLFNMINDFGNKINGKKSKKNYYMEQLKTKKHKKIIIAIYVIYLKFVKDTFEEIHDRYFKEDNKTVEFKESTNINSENFNENNKKYYMCPVYGQISAGQPNWAEQNIEGRLPIDTDLMDIINPEEYFFLRVNGESMNNVIRNGAFALIHKQDVVEDGEIAVVLVNGYDATLKRFTKKGGVVVLEPDSSDPSFKTQIYDKTTSIKILGKYVGKMEINK